ncbi:MAG TPA: galactose oxidase-like domain-containing protein [Nitrososphaera sp.]|nr:galactose oxidase-like domain-containing protein [Nitrososphaera sp.]
MNGSRINRRDFLKLLIKSGSAVVLFSAFGFGGIFNIFFRQEGPSGNRNAGSNIGSAITAGSWSTSSNTVDVAIHAALLGSGKVFYLAGSGFHRDQVGGPYKHAIWDPATNTHTQSTLSEDLFCCGMASLPSGNILLAGGTLQYDNVSEDGKFKGLKSAYEVSFSSGSVGNKTQMRHGRWYPTCVTLPDGKVFVVQGWDELGGNNRLVEIYDPGSKSWTIKLWPGGTLNYCVGSQCYGPGTAPYLSLYPRMHVMPSGLVASVGMESVDRVYEPSTGKWYFAAGNVQKRHYGTSVLLPLQNVSTEKGKILICGGSPSAADPATNSAEIAEPSTTYGLKRRSIKSMTYARKHVTPVILPTGQVVIFGGNKQTNTSPVYAPEMFDPTTETWTVLPSAKVPRQYHSVALLLQDGRIWTAGTTLDFDSKDLRVELFSPGYVTEIRPSISGNISGGLYGGTITIPTPDAAKITKVSLVKTSSVTHHYNTDQRLIWLQIQSRTSSSVTVKAPINSKIAPPGYYLVHILNSANIPSKSKFVKIHT